MYVCTITRAKRLAPSVRDAGLICRNLREMSTLNDREDQSTCVDLIYVKIPVFTIYVVVQVGNCLSTPKDIHACSKKGTWIVIEGIRKTPTTYAKENEKMCRFLF